MSHRIRSTTDNTSHFWRKLVALAVALVLVFIYMANTATDASANDMVALDKLCVEGRVISHQEMPVRRATISATFLDDQSVSVPDTQSNARGEFSFDLPAPGIWSFAIDLSPGWQEVTPATLEIQVAYGSTECIKISFKVKQVVTVEVLKIDDEHVPQEGWVITAEPGPGNTYATEQTATTGPDGIAVFELTTGSWIFREQPPPDVTHWQPISPPSGVQHLVVEAPGPYSIRFKNLIKPPKTPGCIEVIKKDETPGANGTTYGLPDWHVAVLDDSGMVVAEGYTDALGMVKFSDVPEGSYTVKETVQPGWEAVTPAIIGIELTYNNGECKQIEFVNRQKDPGICLEGRKIDEFGEYGIAGWEIDASPTMDGGFDPEPVLTDGLGAYRIDFPLNDSTVHGASYEVCETVKSGWEAVGPSCHTVTVPKHAGACEEVPDFVNRQEKTETEKPKDPPAKHEPAKTPPHNDGYANGCRMHHTVRRGEGLFRIARMYNVLPRNLIRANPWVRKQRNMWLYAGQNLCIP